jgi:drug/metabolite transporter (DMT)-like permease
MGEPFWILAMTLGAAVLAGSHVCAKGAVVRIGISALLWWRAVAALLVSLPLIPLAHVRDASAVGVAHVAAAVLLSPILLNLLFFVGLRVGQVGVQNALRQNSPLAVVLLQAVLLNQPIGPAQWIGMAILALGTAVLAHTQGRSAAITVLAGIAAAMAHGGSIVAQSFAIRHVDQAALIVIQNVAFVAPVAMLLLVRPTSRWSVRQSLSTREKRRGVLLAALSGVGVNLIFDLLKILALPHLGAAVTACLVLLNLPISVAMGYFAFGERPTRAAVVGIFTVLAGAALLAVTTGTAR